MTKFDQLRMEVRAQAKRIAVLEAALAARPARSKRERAPKPSDNIIAARERLWAKYAMLEMQHGHGRMRYTYLAFAMRYGVNPTEFGRWLSPTDRRGIPEGSKPDRSHRRALNAAISELEARAKTVGNANGFSHGNVTHSQDSAARLH